MSEPQWDEQLQTEIAELVDDLNEHDAVDPPPFFVRRVMARIDDSPGHRRPVVSRVWMLRGGLDMTRKALWAVAAVAAVALVIFTITGFPTVDRGTEGTIGAAQRVQSPQISAGDVVVGDTAVQEFLQSEVFDRLLKDEAARKALSDSSLRMLLRNDAINRVLVDNNLRQAVASRALRQVFDNAELRQVLDNPEARKVHADGFLAVPENPKGDVEQHPVVTLDDGLKGVPVSSQAFSDHDEIVSICG